MLRIGLVGFGQHARWAVVPSLQKCEDVTLVAAADMNVANLEELEGDIEKFASHSEMIEKADLDAVYIATLADSHEQIACDALKAGLHVVCEKPMASDAAACRRMVEAAEAAGRQIVIDFPLRFSGHFQQIRQWVRDGRLGRVEAVHIQEFWDGHKAYGPLAERRLRLTEKAGTLDCGIHRADLARFFTDADKWTSVQAIGRWFGEVVSLPPHIAVLAELDNGVLVTLNGSFAYTAYIEPKDKHELFTLVGTKGVVRFFETQDGPHLLRLFSDSGNEEIEVSRQGKAIPALLSEFAAVAEGRLDKPEFGATGLDGLRAQEFVDLANADAVRRREASTEPAAAGSR